MEKEARRRQDMFTEENSLKGMVEEYLEIPLPEMWERMDIVSRRSFIGGGWKYGKVKGIVKRTKVCAMEIWVELLGGEPRDLTVPKAREINDVLRNIEGWARHNKAEGKPSFGRIYGKQRAFLRVEAA